MLVLLLHCYAIDCMKLGECLSTSPLLGPAPPLCACNTSGSSAIFLFMWDFTSHTINSFEHCARVNEVAIVQQFAFATN